MGLPPTFSGVFQGYQLWVFPDAPPGPQGADHSPRVPAFISKTGRGEGSGLKSRHWGHLPSLAWKPRLLQMSSGRAGQGQHGTSSSALSPLLPCSSVPSVIKTWLAWGGFRSGL